MLLINCEINPDWSENWSKKCVTGAPDVANKHATFSIIDTKLYVPFVNLSPQDNTRQLNN